MHPDHKAASRLLLRYWQDSLNFCSRERTFSVVDQRA